MTQNYTLAKSFRDRRRLASTCPCGKNNRDGKFVPFREEPTAGYCHSCQRTIPPNNTNTMPTPANKPPQPPSFIDEKIVSRSLNHYDRNNFAHFFFRLLDQPLLAHTLLEAYSVGTSVSIFPAAVVFWQRDKVGRFRTGKVMGYDPATGKRIKQPPQITFAHKHLEDDNFNLSTVPFGTWLAHQCSLPVAVVESEKTALICAAAFPTYAWVALGGAGNLTQRMIDNLPRRKILLYPDANKVGQWLELCNTISGYDISVPQHAIDLVANQPEDFDPADVVIANSSSKFYYPDWC